MEEEIKKLKEENERLKNELLFLQQKMNLNEKEKENQVELEKFENLAKMLKEIPPNRKLDNKDIKRYARHLLVDEISVEGQQKLINSKVFFFFFIFLFSYFFLKKKVLVVGAGGLGSPILMYLASSGIGYF